MTSSNHYNTFICYNSRDRAQVEAIVDWLEKQGLRLYYDRRAQIPGNLWVREIGEALDRSDAAVICIGPQGFSSWQQREMCYALDRHARHADFRVIPLLLPGGEPPLSMLNLYTWVDCRFGPIDEGHFSILAAAIRGDPPGLEAQRVAHDRRDRANPYRGLRAFREEDAAFFFGREEESRKLLELIITRPLVALQGASGSGKSSIARAGLLPSLRSRDLSEVWEIAVMQPRFDPFVGMADAIIDHLQPALSEVERFAERDKLRELLTKRPAALAEVIERLLQKLSYADRLLLLIDQWEEIYTLVSERELRTQFIDALLLAIDRAPITVLLTVRADHADQALAHPELLRRAHHETMTVGRMAHANHLRAIIEPARLLDVGSEPNGTRLSMPRHTFVVD